MSHYREWLQQRYCTKDDQAMLAEICILTAPWCCICWHETMFQSKRDHIINSTSSFRTLSLGMMKIRQTSSKKVNKINVMPLGTYFPACNNYDWITLIWTSILDATYFLNTLLKILCVIPVRIVKTGSSYPL